MSGIINSAAGSIGSITNGISGSVAGLSNAASSIESLFNGGYGARQGLGIWASTLQPASFRGVPFGVFQSTVKTGRRTAVHEYPFRNEVWVEDLGLGTRSFMFRGFLVGDDVFAQRDKMVTAIETAGPGILVHPSLGSKQVSLVDFSVTERAEQGRVVELEFTFIQTVGVIMPVAMAQTKNGILSAISGAISAVQSDFSTYVLAPLSYGASVVQQATSTVDLWISVATGLTGDVGAIAASTAGLLGNNGRYANGAVSTPAPASATTASMIAAQVTNRVAVDTANAALATAATALSTTTTTAFGSAVQAVITALLAAAQDPVDQVRLMVAMQNFNPAPPSWSAPIGAARMVVELGIAALCRRAALIGLANACEAYQPTSSNDAQALMAQVTPLFDAEITVAADAGQDATYLAMRTLRAAVVKDMIIRGARLPALRTVTTGAPMPALTLAYQLYEDATRSDDLIQRADPVHPAFMPTSFQALSS